MISQGAAVAGPPLMSGVGALVFGVGHGLVAAVPGAGTVASVVGPPTLPGGASLASGVGHGMLAIAKAVHMSFELSC